MTFTTDGVDHESGHAAGRRADARVRSQMPLVLPAGPTHSDPAGAPADVVAGTDEDDFDRDGTSIVKGKAVLLPRDGG